MLEERDARIAVLEAALEPFAKLGRTIDDPRSPDVKNGKRAKDQSVFVGQVLYDADGKEEHNPITFGDLRRAAAAFPTHSEGGEADTRSGTDGTPRSVHIAQPLSDEDCSTAAVRSQAEANVLAVRSWDAPGFEACVTAEMEKMKAALETLGASPSPSALTEEVREKADLAICGIGHLLSHLPDDDNGFSEMKNEDLLYIYAVYVAELMKRDPTDPVGAMFAHLTKPASKGGT